jgi:DNA mismatch repair protein MSH5
MKQTYDGIDDLLTRTARAVASTVPDHFSLDLNVIFFPQIGFLISMPLDAQTAAGTYEGQDDEGGTWDKMFTTELRAYYKDFRMREMDETFGDMYALICGTYNDRSLVAALKKIRQRDRDCSRTRTESTRIRRTAYGGV